MAERNSRGAVARWTIFAVVAVLAVAMIVPFLIPMAVGGIFGVILYPLHSRFRPKRLGPNAAAIVSTLVFALLVFIPVATALFAAVQTGLEQLQQWGADVEQRNGVGNAAGGSGDWLREIGVWLRSQPFVDRIVDALPISTEDFQRMWRKMAASVGAWLSGLLQTFMAGVPQALIWSVVMFVTFFFCLRDGSKLVEWVRRRSPFTGRATERLIHSVEASCKAVVLASMASGAVQAAIIALGCIITGTPGVALIAFVTFLASFVPLVGTGPVTLGLVAYSLVSGDSTAAIILLAFGGLAGISDNFVRPYVIQGGEAIHPLLAFVSVFGALGVIGVSGILIGPILVSVAVRMVPVVLQGEEPERTARIAG